MSPIEEPKTKAEINAIVEWWQRVREHRKEPSVSQTNNPFTKWAHKNIIPFNEDVLSAAINHINGSAGLDSAVGRVTDEMLGPCLVELLSLRQQLADAREHNERLKRACDDVLEMLAIAGKTSGRTVAMLRSALSPAPPVLACEGKGGGE
jgi:hypothetical protein